MNSMSDIEPNSINSLQEDQECTRKARSLSDDQSIFSALKIKRKISDSKTKVYLGYFPKSKDHMTIKIFPYKKDKPDSTYINESQFQSLRHQNIIFPSICLDEIQCTSKEQG
mmetsp:Transcript_25250/g.22256  ORF Transcript_25250/g.22256 Transcript_25250/m.22256 type:complete len:112 (-) Transcript_25250:345-680(-)